MLDILIHYSKQKTKRPKLIMQIKSSKAYLVLVLHPHKRLHSSCCNNRSGPKIVRKRVCDDLARILCQNCLKIITSIFKAFKYNNVNTVEVSWGALMWFALLSASYDYFKKRQRYFSKSRPDKCLRLSEFCGFRVAF